MPTTIGLRPGPDVDVEAISEFCRATMARFQVPRYLELVESLPKTPTGKLDKTPLRDRPIVGPATWYLERPRARS
jgi:acyl-CoA synthetase (AMP-forming)/AMP-acid ligase II